MNKEELIKKVRKIEIKTRGLSNDIFAGKYHSAFKGRGMSFSEVRDYRIGDDIRDIDWNVTARSNKPHVKVYEEERELTMMLLIDVSASGDFGTQGRFKRELATEISAVLSFSAAKNNDKIGVIFFSDRIEKYIPPKKGRQHVLRIISDILDFEPQGTGTDIGGALKFFANVIKKRCTAFLISDMISEDNFDDSMKIAAGKHDLVALRLYDLRDGVMPNVGIVEFRDLESGKKVWVDTASQRVRDQYSDTYNRQLTVVDSVMLKNRVDNVAIATDEDYVGALIRLFKMR